MFSFDQWADWFGQKVRELDGHHFTLIKPHDTRSIPECSLNPSFGLQLDSDDRIGLIGFWKNELCDYQVIDVRSGLVLANETMRAANDETVEALFSHFLSFYDNEAL
jgi:hypothetical protein